MFLEVELLRPRVYADFVIVCLLSLLFVFIDTIRLPSRIPIQLPAPLSWTNYPNLFRQYLKGASQMVLELKKLTANAGDVRDRGPIPGLGRSPGGGHGNPLQCSCLENPMDRGACWTTAHRTAQDKT